MILYIDPGTGSMLFYLVIGLVSVAYFSARKLWIKLKYLTFGGVRKDDKKIPLVIFADGRQYWQTFEPVCRELDNRSFDVTYYTMSDDDPALSTDLRHVHAEFIGSGNKAFARMNMLNADIVLSTTPGLDVFQWKSSKNVKYYAHMLHSTDVAGYEMFGVDFYDGLLLGAEHEALNIRELEKLRNEPAKEIHYIGIPYWDEMLKRIKDSSSPKSAGRTVLIAPSWGDRCCLLKQYGEAVIDKLLESGYHVILRPHPQSYLAEKDVLDKFYAKYEGRIEWNRDADNFDVLNRADIMISECSGVVYDFACVFDKPVIIMKNEINAGIYDLCWLGETPYWTREALSEVGEELTEENICRLDEMIEKCITDDFYRVNRQKLRDETWMYQGSGAQRAADFLIDKYESLSKE